MNPEALKLLKELVDAQDANWGEPEDGALFDERLTSIIDRARLLLKQQEEG